VHPYQICKKMKKFDREVYFPQNARE